MIHLPRPYSRRQKERAGMRFRPPFSFHSPPAWQSKPGDELRDDNHTLLLCPDITAYV